MIARGYDAMMTHARLFLFSLAVAGIAPSAGCVERRPSPEPRPTAKPRWSEEPVIATCNNYDGNEPLSLAPRSIAPRRLHTDEPLRLSDYGETLFAADAPPASSAPSADGPAHTGPLPRFRDTLRRDLRDMPHDLWSDTKRVFGNPVNLAIFGVTYAGSLAIQKTGPDDTVEDHYNNHHTFDKDWRDAFGALGNPGTHFALAGAWYLAGQRAQDNKTYEVGRTLFSALTINGLSVVLGQAASADRSPNGEYGTFPSGHTSSTFVVASVMHEAYGPWVGAPLYGLGALVAIERLDDREHYLSDVVFGGVMGIVIGHSVASGRDAEVFGWKVMPYADPYQQSTGVALYKSLP